MIGTLGQLLIVLGAICILASVAGGGVKGFGVEFTANLSRRRQIAVGILGAVFIGLGIGIIADTSGANNRTAQAPPPNPVGNVPPTVAPGSSTSRRSKTYPTAPSPTPPSHSGNTDEPSIRSVTPIRPTGNQAIVIAGSGFGAAPSFNGQTPFLRITDLTHGNWIAGWSATSTVTESSRASILVSEWSDNRIVVDQIIGYGTWHESVVWTYNVGDVVKIEIANPHGRGLPPPNTMNWPGVATFTARVTN